MDWGLKATFQRVFRFCLSRPSRFGCALFGGAATVISAAIYLVGGTRALGYDSAVTVASFVATPSLLDPFRRQVVFNNHPLFSFAEHLIYNLTGSQAEIVMRLLPIAAGALAVGVLTAAVARVHGILPAATAGLLLATNPVFVAESRDVRGYSLVVLMVTCASISLILMLRQLGSPRGNAWLGRAYLITMAVAIGTHVFAIFALTAHFGYLAGRRKLSAIWIMRMIAATGLGCLPYTLLFSQMATSAGARRIFQFGFPTQIAVDLLGGVPWIVVAVGGLAILGAVKAQDRTSILTAGLTTTAAVAVVWLWGPADLYSRFFLWLLPGVSVLVGSAVASRPGLAVVAVLACITAWVTSVAPGYTEDPLANRAAAEIINAAAARGYVACAAGYTVETLPVYTKQYYAVQTVADLDRCDLLVILKPDEPSHHAWAVAASTALPVKRSIPAASPGLLLTRVAG